MQQKYGSLKVSIFKLFARKLIKNVKKMEDAISKQAAVSEISVTREYVCFMIKAFIESF